MVLIAVTRPSQRGCSFNTLASSRTRGDDIGYNPHHDNGIKLFGPDGFKLDDRIESEISDLAGISIALAKPHELGGHAAC